MENHFSVCYIGGNRNRTIAVRHDFVCGSLNHILVNVKHNNICTVFSETLCERLSYTTPSASNYSCFIFEAHNHPSFTL